MASHAPVLSACLPPTPPGIFGTKQPESAEDLRFLLSSSAKELRLPGIFGTSSQPQSASELPFLLHSSPSQN
eukprot:12184929-Karenia_brevis.AAC.1